MLKFKFKIKRCIKSVYYELKFEYFTMYFVVYKYFLKMLWFFILTSNELVYTCLKTYFRVTYVN